MIQNAHIEQFKFGTNANHSSELHLTRNLLMEAATRLATDFNSFADEQKCWIKEFRKEGGSVPDFAHKLFVNRHNNCSKNRDILIWCVSGRIHRTGSVSLVKKPDGLGLQVNLLELAFWRKGYLKGWKSKILKVEIAASYLRYVWQKNEEMIDLLEKSPHCKYLEIATIKPADKTEEEILAEIDEESRWLQSLEEKREERNRRRREKCKLKAAVRVENNEAVSA